MKKILILTGRYLPGYKDGGPLRTFINLTETLGDEYEFYIGCLDRDQGDKVAYPNIKLNVWNQVGKAKVWYVSPGGFTNKLILKLAAGKDMIYLSSFYGDYGYKTLLLKKREKLTCPIALASMGVFSKEALAHKPLKKSLFINGCKLLGLFNDITWSVTSELEASDVKNVIGKNIRYVIAEDLPRNSVPGRTKKWEKNLKICFLSRICEHKGLDILIDALKRMDTSQITLSIWGPIQEKGYWKECLNKLKETDIQWKYEGNIPSEHVQKCLAKQDVLVLPSKSENYGHVVFEALSVGCIPIISDRTPWTVLQERKAGYVVPRTAEDFKKGLHKLVELDIEEKQNMSRAAVELAWEKVEQSKKETGYRKIFG